MKAALVQALVFVIETPLAIFIILGFCLLVLLHFIVPPEEIEEEEVHLPPEPKDNLWQL